MDYGFVSIPAIAVICYLVSEFLKAMGIKENFIPVACGLAGGVLGAAAMFLMPDFPANDMLTAVAIGIVSGGGATWAHQVVKQTGKG